MPRYSRISSSRTRKSSIAIAKSTRNAQSRGTKFVTGAVNTALKVTFGSPKK